MWDMRRRKKLEHMRQKQAAKEFDGCTFRPQITKKNLSGKNGYATAAATARSGMYPSKR